MGTHTRFHFRQAPPPLSTFLSSFAPRPLRRFSAPMRTLTPRQVSGPTEVSPFHVTRPYETILPPTTPCPPWPLSHATPQRHGLPFAGLGFAFTPQARRIHKAESSSSGCGLVSRLRLLPTPPHGDAVTFGFRPESVCLKRTCTSLNECAHGRTERRRPAGSFFLSRPFVVAMRG